MVNTHSETGYTILKGIPFPWPVAEIVRQHHERVDGTGFPLGLKGDAILLEARVLAVADTVEAMSSYRPYRATSKIDAVLKEIERRAGSQLDAEVVRVCLSLFRKKGYLLPSANIG
jgi:HD-GYP domain-containing protein (c-di-GMP phosphodiesterase class II)